MSLSLSVHGATTRHLASCYFFQADPPPGAGPLLGLDARSRQTFCFSPFAAYAKHLVTNPNLLVLGEVGSGKSSLAKLICWTEQALLGRFVAVLDPKGEYGPLAALLGLTSVRLAPGGRARLDPLAPGPGPAILDEHRRRRLEVLGALGECVLGRVLSPEERAGLDAVLGELEGTPRLSEIVAGLLEPGGAAAASLHTSTESLAAGCRELALGLRRLVSGDLAGMFEGPSTVRLADCSAGVHLDLSPVYQSPGALAPTMVAAGSWLAGAMSVPGRQSLLVLDETWQVLADAGIGRWLRSTMKLARGLGAAVVLVTHGLSDFAAVGDARSEAARLSASLVADAGSVALLHHGEAALQASVEAFGLSGVESELLSNLRRGTALWHLGGRAYVVHHLVPAELLEALDTDAEMLGRAPGTPVRETPAPRTRTAEAA
jgi:type IV secretory pathway VirB4 component